MKNTNIVYGFLGLTIVFLLGIIVYLYQDNLKKTAILEKQSAIKPIADIPMENIFKLLETAVREIEGGDSEVVFANLNKETEYCGTAVDFAKVYFKTMEESLESARTKAQVAFFKSTAFSTLPAVIICMDNNSFVNSPKKEESICQGDDSNKWPNFSNLEGAQWGGCDFEIDKKKRTFKYCATFGEIKIVCTQDGCKF
ncbi:MAG: hypothetical protein ACD_7C00573G0003 [uncultured bacterium]|nr:MAG: hypothetical protein ACD_7C00573G0003 [uncultured bacterium]KKP68358.1 MAG: hypothetical protein UR66_C0006G0059 [Candidatus Moranbacteria bacterium GW2011_GWE1_35_17]KKP69853.1 MAG: hypothetical protein UR65_C0047G0005 [Candidatus Moranbacteria bacterium GW2011_GWE2_35_164]KKP84257.1 MAG: hypothetical protein UR82_C0009G0004 [Candidatus Moranbacteria bacterium GW2011_GWF1_35_5]KKP84931.1 MAG: hypothetical protein UR83_C0008G0045 [Candidatus Moranbacteria bacterium GW2011_GWF2_35_54]